MIWPWSASGRVAHGAGSLQIISMYFTGDSSPGVLATPSSSVTPTTGRSGGIDSPRAGMRKNFGRLSPVLGGRRGPEYGGQVLPSGVVAAATGAPQVPADQHDQLHRVGQVVDPGLPTPGVGVEQARGVVALPVRAHAVAVDHEPGDALHGDRHPDG